MEEFKHLKIHLRELKKATNSFRSKVIGNGGFGKVYEGEVSHSKGRSMVAIKRLSREFGQGDAEFWKEIMMLSRYTHKNLISLLGFCDEDGEKIIVYEYAFNGSLDRHLSSTHLTWTQRLKICLDVAKGLAYLHDHRGTQQRVLHRDIKSSNILLDENWNAKLSDMGLSKLGPANQPHTVLFTQVVGTLGYCDPQYLSTYTLTKESDIYSLGVVLFEVLCGRLCYQQTNSQFDVLVLVSMWKESYERKKLDRIIFKDLTPYMDPASLEIFSDIAFQCLHYSREQRPTTALLVEKLEAALRFQERYDMKLELTNAVETLQKSSYVDLLSFLLSKGKEVFFHIGKKEREGAEEKDVAEEGVSRLVHFDGAIGFTVEEFLHADGEEMGISTNYGTLFKTTFRNGDQVAVYRLGETSTKNRRELEVELNLVGKIRHPNILSVRAYYLDPIGDKLLFHDYMPKGSLADILYAIRPDEKRLDWPTRMEIAKGVARGLLCLHTHHNIIHGNLTSHNVWLDENFNPKISDFGFSLKNINPEARFLCYRDPKLKYDNKANTETDIYSLGMIMLELLTGKSPANRTDGLDLPQWVANSLEKNDLNDWLFNLRKVVLTATVDRELLKSLQLALDCVRPSPWVRPDIQLVLQRLKNIRP